MSAAVEALALLAVLAVVMLAMVGWYRAGYHQGMHEGVGLGQRSAVKMIRSVQPGADEEPRDAAVH